MVEEGGKRVWGVLLKMATDSPLSLQLHINGVISEHSVHGESTNKTGQAPLKAACGLASISLYPGALFSYYYRATQINVQLPVGLTDESLTPLGTTPFQGVRPTSWGDPLGYGAVVSLTVPGTREAGCCCSAGCRSVDSGEFLMIDIEGLRHSRVCLCLFLIEPS